MEKLLNDYTFSEYINELLPLIFPAMLIACLIAIAIYVFACALISLIDSFGIGEKIKNWVVKKVSTKNPNNGKDKKKDT